MAFPPIVSPHIRLRHPGSFEVGAGSIVDDFCYISARVKVGIHSHIASGCSIAGGVAHLFTLGDFSSLSAGVRIWCASDDFTRDIVTVFPDEAFGAIKENFIAGDVTCDRLTAVGSNSVVMPRNHVPEGTVIGALSFVPPEFPFEPWMVYAGTPIRPVKRRDRDSVLRQLAAFEAELRRRAEAGA